MNKRGCEFDQVAGYGGGGAALLMHTHDPSKSQTYEAKFKVVGKMRFSLKIQKGEKNRHISMENKVQYQALVKLDCYITAECQTEPKENGQSMWSAESPKAPRLTTVSTPGQFSNT